MQFNFALDPFQWFSSLGGHKTRNSSVPCSGADQVFTMDNLPLAVG